MIHAFRGLRYTERAGPLQNLVTHPYDKIGAEDLVRFRAQSPYSAVHLIRGEAHAEDRSWYADSAARVHRWLADGILAREDRDVFYVLRQEFRDHRGHLRRRTAVVGALDLRARDRVLPHERTHARAKEDRFRLLSATGMHFGLVFLLRAGGANFDPAALDGEPVGRVLGLEGANHEFSIVRDPERVAALARALADGPFVIADGHHRFATACRYADLHPAADRLLVGVVDVEDPDLVILPTHRLLSGIDRAAVAALVAKLRTSSLPAGVSPVDAVAERGPGTIGLVFAGATPPRLWTPAPTGDALVDLDVACLERELLGPLLSGLDTEDHLRYLRDPAPGLAAVQDGSADLLALVAGIPASTVVSIARRREVMPQKSTDFYPKLPTGFVYLPASTGGP